MDKWLNKVAVVTGASSGIGAAITEALAQEGMIVVGLARRKELIEALAVKNKEAKGKIYAIECDITKSDSIERAFEWIEETLGGVDVLVNNAGLVKKGHIFDLSVPEEEYLVTINTNLTGVLLVTRRAYKTMKDKEFGYIININSTIGQITVNELQAKVGFNVYGPTKHALTQLSILMRMELTEGKKNIRVTNLSPGAVETNADYAANLSQKGQPRWWDLMAHLQPEDISTQVVYLLSQKPHVVIRELTIECLDVKSSETS